MMNALRSSRPSHRRRAAVLVAASALLLAGCGSSGDDNDAKASDSAPTVTASPTDGATTTAPGTAPGTETGTSPDGRTADGTGVIDNGRNDSSATAQEQVFSVLSPWNRPVFNARVAPNSDALVANANIRVGRNVRGQRTREVNDEGVYINTVAWTVPVVAGGTPTVVHCRQENCGDGDEDFTLDLPTDVDPATIYDGWYTVFDEANRTAYDFWRARREDNGVLSYQFVQLWDLDGPGFKQPYVVSARGSGLPLFAGLIRPGELERCQINHALAISLPGPASGSFVQPASSTDGNGLRGALPEGARIRLKNTFILRTAIDELTGKAFPVTADQNRNADCIVKTLKTYGAIVVDRAAVPTLYFQRIDTGRREPLLNGYELQTMKLEDFDAIDFSSTERFPFPRRDEVVDGNSADVNTNVDTTTTGEQ